MVTRSGWGKSHEDVFVVVVGTQHELISLLVVHSSQQHTNLAPIFTDRCMRGKKRFLYLTKTMPYLDIMVRHVGICK